MAYSLDQEWFWTERWQKLERAAQADVDSGKVVRFESWEDIVVALLPEYETDPELLAFTALDGEDFLEL